MTFNPILHEYRDGETILPSVTQILSKAGLINSRFFTPESCERGTVVHALCQRYANGERVDDVGRPLESFPYINTLASWFREHRAYTVETEKMIEGETDGLLYAGTYDLLVEIDGQKVLVDYKTGGVAKWHSVQLAAYTHAVNPDRCMALYIQRDGTYKERNLSGQELLDAWIVFKNALKEWEK